MAGHDMDTTDFSCQHCGDPIELAAVAQHQCFLGRNVFAEGNILFAKDNEPIVEKPTCEEEDKKQKAEWNQRSTLALISLYEANLYLIDHPKKKTKIWAALSESLRELHSIQVTADQVRWRMSYLLSKYKKCADNNAKSGRALQTFEYYDRLEEFLGQERIASAAYTKSSKVPSKTTPKIDTPKSTIPPRNDENHPPERPSTQKRANDDDARPSTSTGRPGHGTGSKLSKGKLELQTQWLDYLAGASGREAERNKKYERNLKLQQEKMDMKRALVDKRLKSKEKRHKDILEIERQKLNLLTRFFNKEQKKEDPSSDTESD